MAFLILSADACGWRSRPLSTSSPCPVSPLAPRRHCHAPARMGGSLSRQGADQAAMTKSQRGALAEARQLQGRRHSRQVFASTTRIAAACGHRRGCALPAFSAASFMSPTALPVSARGVCPPAEGEAARAAVARTVKPDLLIITGWPFASPAGICAHAASAAQANLPDHDGTPPRWSAIFFCIGSPAPQGRASARGMIASCQAACAAMLGRFFRNARRFLIDWCRGTTCSAGSTICSR